MNALKVKPSLEYASKTKDVEHHPTLNISRVDGHICFFESVTRESQIVLETMIREEISERLIKSSMSGTRPSPIILQINSTGGDGFVGAALYDFISMNNDVVPIMTVIDGIAASAASLIFLAGQYREMTPNSMFLIHEGSFGSSGKTTEVIDSTALVEKLNMKVAEIYASELKLDLKEGEDPLDPARIARIREFIRRDRSYNYEELEAIGGLIKEPEYPTLNEEHQKIVIDLTKKFMKEEQAAAEKEAKKEEKAKSNKEKKVAQKSK